MTEVDLAEEIAHLALAKDYYYLGILSMGLAMVVVRQLMGRCSLFIPTARVIKFGITSVSFIMMYPTAMGHFPSAD